MIDISYKSRLCFDSNVQTSETISIDLKRFPERIDFENELIYQAELLGLEELLEKAAHLKTLIFYKGPIDLSLHFLKNQKHLESYENWQQDVFQNKRGLKQDLRLFAIELFMNYLHRLASVLPDNVQAAVEFTDLLLLRPSEAAQLLSKNRFSHFDIINNPFDGNEGLILPEDPLFTADIFDKIDDLLTLKKNQMRVIPEELLPEMWGGLTTLYAIEPTLSRFGKRGIEGFLAAEGEVIYF